ncbi:MAG: 4-hydroxy-tetrahydrodipicolinate synthase [Culturomica sp.]|jgi:4-hydroxy-tetrahydrodipicolinate synthase|nr:4-hydroxy-tetrahydrodipicolinate synthase [Culturomica sp.]
MNRFTGTGVALVTPFSPDGEIDGLSLRRLVNSVIAGGVDYLVALGTTSESATLSAKEREEVVRIILEENNGRLPVMVGFGGNNTRELLETIRNFPYLRECSAILSVVPYYSKPTQEGLYRHFMHIGENAPLPVFLYNVPGRTAVNMEADTVVRLAKDCSNIIGLKEAAGSLGQATDIIRAVPAHFTVVSGDDGLTLPLMAIGAQGVIAVVANACPREFSELVRLAAGGDFKSATAIHHRLAPLYKALFAEGNPAGVKAALHIRGIIASTALRLPLVPASDALYAHLKECLRLGNPL